MSDFLITLNINVKFFKQILNLFYKKLDLIVIVGLVLLSVNYFMTFYFNGLSLAYNDARSHLDIGRRVVEGIKPGMAQLGSVWLPLNHVLMIPTVWSDFMWHSGLSGAIISMVGYVGTGYFIYKFLKEIGVKTFGRILGVAVFALNLNVLYLQSTAMTELLLVVTATAASYYLMLWAKKGLIVDFVKTGFWVMLATLTRYDGWFLFFMETGLIGLIILFKNQISPRLIFKAVKDRFREIEGGILMFATLAGFGIGLWFLWNQLIFNDALYFALGPFSAHAQQKQLAEAGNLITKGHWLLSIKTYFYALFFNSNTFFTLFSFLGGVLFAFDKKIKDAVRVASLSLTAPLIFNILALYLGFSVLFIQGINGDTWFNARYGVLLVPTIAIFVGYLIDRLSSLKFLLAGIIVVLIFLQFANYDAVTIDDARVGSSQKNVSEVSGWLSENAKEKDGFILISAASHDAIIFSSGLPMSKFIHEGTGKYWESATTNPERWARWIIMRSYDENDQTWKTVSKTPDINSYTLVEKYPFADIYELRPEFLPNLNTKPVLGKQK